MLYAQKPLLIEGAVGKIAWTVGDVVRKLRKARGFKRYDEFAKAAAVNPSTVNRLENDGVDSDTKSIAKIAEALGETLGSLYEMRPITVLYEESRIAAELLDAMPSREDRRGALEALRAYASAPSIGDAASH